MIIILLKLPHISLWLWRAGRKCPRLSWIGSYVT